MPGTILLVDNQADALEKWGELLEHDGYDVLRAATLEEAEKLLLHRRVHLAILDIRMQDEDSENDISGLLLALRPEFQPIPKIILTAHPSYEYVRLALAPDMEGRIPASNFIAKAEGPRALRQAVEGVFSNQVRLNWDLRIDLDPRERLSFAHLVGLLQPDLPTEALLEHAGELEDLFRRLFYDYRQIRIDRPLWHGGGRFCLAVLARSAQGAIDPRLLVCGERRHLEHELKRIRELAPETVLGMRLVDTAETMRFGAAAYVLPDVSLETVHPLRDLFVSGKERALKLALGALLQGNLDAWHRRGHTVEEAEVLMALYRRRAGLGENGIAQAEAERRAEALIHTTQPLSTVRIERGGGLVTLHFPHESPITCPDPISMAYGSSVPGTPTVICKVSPGRLTADNILVDDQHRTWLTDFSDAGQAPQWWDFVCVEAMVRFDLSQAPDLLAWQDFEESLVAPVSLDDRLRSDRAIADLRTSLTMIEQIRRQAGSETGLDALPYYAGLLVWAVGAMVQFDPGGLYNHAERMRGAHLLLAAALIAGRIDELARQQKQASGSPGVGEGQRHSQGLRLDEDRVRVWVGARRAVVLTAQELELFRCLYDHAGKVVPRKTLVEQVFGEPYVSGDKYQEGRLNSLAARLRDKIEPDPDRPRYIFTVRGQGYRMKTGE